MTKNLDAQLQPPETREGLRELMARLGEHNKIDDLGWVVENGKRIEEKYVGKEIAVYNQHIIAVADGLLRLKEKIKPFLKDYAISCYRVPSSEEISMFYCQTS